MAYFHIIILALIQGITEFLPISSSGHLILLPQLTPLADQGAALDVAVHLGTLVAVVVYFRTDVARLATGFVDLCRGRLNNANAFLALAMVIATLPVIALGLMLKVTGLIDAMRSITVIGWAMLGFGVLLYWADQKHPEDREAGGWTLKHAFQMGFWQAIALIPGTSRAGICITGARMLGYKREDAAKLSMLMSIPTILAAGVLTGIDVIGTANWQTLQDGAIAALFSCLAAFAALALMMKLLKSVSYTPYVIYRVVLGVALLVIGYTAT